MSRHHRNRSGTDAQCAAVRRKHEGFGNCPANIDPDQAIAQHRDVLLTRSVGRTTPQASYFYDALAGTPGQWRDELAKRGLGSVEVHAPKPGGAVG